MHYKTKTKHRTPQNNRRYIKHCFNNNRTNTENLTKVATSEERVKAQTASDKIYYTTVKPVLTGYSKIDKSKVYKADGSLMQVKSVCRMLSWSILQ